jgi:ADP-ribose pyrophosphatase YjhB (NUDIX family)
VLRRLAYRFRQLYWRLVRPRTLGVKCLVVSDQRVLLVRTTYDRYWALPGGAVERGESFAEGARRELREETGLDLDGLRLFQLYHSQREDKDDHVALFVAETVDGQPRADGREVADLGFFRLDQLPPETSPATRRRIAEYLAGRAASEAW